MKDILKLAGGIVLGMLLYDILQGTLMHWVWKIL